MKIFPFLTFGLLVYGVIGEDILSKFNQNQYKVKDVRAEVAELNKEFVNNMTVVTYKYNRTTPAINISLNLKIDVDDKLETVIQAYRFASNQYRLFPLRFQVNVQEALDANAVGLQAVKKCGNIKKVYFLKNITYYVCNFVVDDTKLPPLIPPGQYKITLDVIYVNYHLGTCNAYAEIYTPIKYPK